MLVIRYFDWLYNNSFIHPFYKLLITLFALVVVFSIVYLLLFLFGILGGVFSFFASIAALGNV